MGKKIKLKEEVTTKYRESLQQGMNYSIAKFDEQVLYLSSGALVLSLSFIGTVVTLDKSIWVGLLYASWFALLTTSIFSVYTHLKAYDSHDAQLDRLEKGEPLKLSDKDTVFRNRLMFSFMTIGFLFQIGFIIINIQHMKDESVKPHTAGSTSSTSTIHPLDTVTRPSIGDVENLGLPVMQVPAALRPPADSTTSGTKK
jgi:hypothetical protein